MKSFRTQFPLSSDDCELLLEFELYPSLIELAAKMQRDHSIIARAIKRLSERFPVVEKKNGKWVITELGRRINESSRVALMNQISTLNEQSSIKLGTNREFSSTILVSDFQVLRDIFQNMQISISTYEKGVEKALIDGKIDIGLDCDRPYSPEISYKLVIDEPILAVASKNFIKYFKNEINLGKYTELPHLFCDRLHPDKILSSSENQLLVEACFNDITTTKVVCIQGIGWALLPAYTIKNELHSGKLVQIDPQIFGKSKYGVWWLRSRPQLKASCEKLIQWLQQQEL